MTNESCYYMKRGSGAVQWKIPTGTKLVRSTVSTDIIFQIVHFVVCEARRVIVAPSVFVGAVYFSLVGNSDACLLAHLVWHE